MKKTKIKLATFLCTAGLVTGCATTEQTAGLAATACSGVGILTGILTGSAEAGVGAGVGCLALALVINHYYTTQSRTVAEDQKLYGYTTPTNTTEVKIRNATAFPEKVRIGDKLKIGLDYSVIAPQGTQNVNVLETMTLKKDGQVLKELSNRQVNRPLGGGTSEVDFTIPNNMPPGTYVIEQKIQSGTSYDLRPAVFVVSA